MPSGFLLADAFIRLDLLLEKGMLNPSEGDSKVLMALRDAKRLKALVGALRHLFRNSPSDSRSIFQSDESDNQMGFFFSLESFMALLEHKAFKVPCKTQVRTRMTRRSRS